MGGNLALRYLEAQPERVRRRRADRADGRHQRVEGDGAVAARSRSSAR